MLPPFMPGGSRKVQRKYSCWGQPQQGTSVAVFTAASAQVLGCRPPAHAAGGGHMANTFERLSNSCMFTAHAIYYARSTTWRNSAAEKIRHNAKRQVGRRKP
jgi:hypothetical protein